MFPKAYEIKSFNFLNFLLIFLTSLSFIWNRTQMIENNSILIIAVMVVVMVGMMLMWGKAFAGQRFVISADSISNSASTWEDYDESYEYEDDEKIESLTVTVVVLNSVDGTVEIVRVVIIISNDFKCFRFN